MVDIARTKSFPTDCKPLDTERRKEKTFPPMVKVTNNYVYVMIKSSSTRPGFREEFHCIISSNLAIVIVRPTTHALIYQVELTELHMNRCNEL